jgi:alkylhydroperoxidase family enzyme
MPTTRQAAIVRLIGHWCARVIEDDSYALRVTLADVLTAEAIEAVRRGNLLAEFDPDRPNTSIPSLPALIPSSPLPQTDRRRAALIRAWRALRPSWGRVQ